MADDNFSVRGFLMFHNFTFFGIPLIVGVLRDGWQSNISAIRNLWRGVRLMFQCAIVSRCSQMRQLRDIYHPSMITAH